MVKQINKRQKPVWKSLRKPMAPPAKVHQPQKGLYDRKKTKQWEKELEEEITEGGVPVKEL